MARPFLFVIGLRTTNDMGSIICRPDMTYDVPWDVLRTLTKGIFDAVDQQNTKDDVALKTLSAVLDKHAADMPRDLRVRFEKLAQIRRDFLRSCKEFDQAHAARDTEAADVQLDRINTLGEQSKEIAAFLQFPFAAEELVKAKGFDAFCAALPNVDLNALYGSGHGKTSPFPLIWAMSARNKPLERVQLMLAAGASVKLRTRRGETVLHAMAAMKRKAAVRLAILRLLIFKGADLEATDIYRMTPLNVAIYRGSIEDVGCFLAAGAKVGQMDVKGATSDPRRLALVLSHLENDPKALTMAASLGGWLRGEIATFKDVYTTELSKGPTNGFHHKALDQLQQSLSLLASLPGFASEDLGKKVTWQEEPAAFWSVRGAETLDDYRAALARVDIKTFSMPGTHPIYWPLEAKDHRPERLWLMLSAGASVTGGANGTALHIFAQNRRKDKPEQLRIAQMLVQAGAKLEVPNYEGRTPLAIAVMHRGVAETAALLKLCASPKTIVASRRLFGEPYQAPLIFEAAGDFRIFKNMLEYNAATDVTDNADNTLEEFLQQEIDRLGAMQEMDASGNIIRHVDRLIRNYTKSLDFMGKGTTKKL